MARRSGHSTWRPTMATVKPQVMPNTRPKVTSLNQCTPRDEAGVDDEQEASPLRPDTPSQRQLGKDVASSAFRLGRTVINSCG
jgi:hypothetical protein